MISNVDIFGYELISEPSLSNAGGVAFYIKNSLQYHLRSEFTCSTPDFEALWIEIHADGQQNLLCGVIYRHPNSNLDNFLEYISLTTEKINQESKLCLIMGDYNIDLLKINSHTDSENFLNTLGSSCFLPHILKPTRITDHSASLIDNIFFNSLEHYTISGNLVYALTDHLPNFIIFNKFSALRNNLKVYKRDFSTLDEAAMIEEVRTVNWESTYSSLKDPSFMFDTFYDKISQIIDKHIPIKQLSRKELKLKSKPWITPAIKKSISVKNRLYKKYLKTKSVHHHSKFKYYRNKLNHLLKLSKRSYYNNYFLVNSNNPKRVWNGIKEIVRFKPKKSNKIVKVIENGIDITDPKLVANAFNDYFANVGNNLAQQIPSIEGTPFDFLNSPSRSSFYIFPVTENEIQNEISALKKGKASGPFSIPINILKTLSNVISKPLEILFNASFSLGIVPQNLKLANVIPVHKKGQHSSPHNYRPISLLSVFNKILEKLMCNRLLNFLDKNNVFFDKQFGFRARHSTDHAILSIIDKIQSAVETQNYSCGIFLDFSKAFDTVNHGILLKKLDYYGIRGVANAWFTSYLNNRQQTVTINNATSDNVTLTCGIPQGSVLGPILFLLYINDFHLCSSLFDFHLFADDANLFYSHDNINIMQQNINAELSNIYTWLCINRLSLNIEKSNFVIFQPRQKKSPLNFIIQLNGKILKRENCIKYLGIFIDSTLSWKDHVEYISKKIRKSIGILSKIRYFVDSHTLIQLYYALIQPFLVYGLIVWGNTYPATLHPLFILQKKATRLITFSQYDQHTSPLFKSLDILKLSDLVNFQTAVFMYKFHNRLLPSVFNNFFTPNSRIHGYNTRSVAKHSYYLPRARTNYGIFNIRFQGTKVWNSIDNHLKLMNLGQFKNKYKKEMTKKY